MIEITSTLISQSRLDQLLLVYLGPETSPMTGLAIWRWLHWESIVVRFHTVSSRHRVGLDVGVRELPESFPQAPFGIRPWLDRTCLRVTRDSLTSHFIVLRSE